jgi:hypothetical protein
MKNGFEEGWTFFQGVSVLKDKNSTTYNIDLFVRPEFNEFSDEDKRDCLDIYGFKDTTYYKVAGHLEYEFKYAIDYIKLSLKMLKDDKNRTLQQVNDLRRFFGNPPLIEEEWEPWNKEKAMASAEATRRMFDC